MGRKGREGREGRVAVGAHPFFTVAADWMLSG